ncbi:MAG: serine/threonine-protein kinase, partial [Myxococcota bacterium]
MKATAPNESLVGTIIDRYEVLEVLGEGGFGTVYRARHSMLGQDCALKVLHPHRAAHPTIARRFLQEAKAAAAAGSPHIVRVTDAGIADGRAFLAMELLSGETLEAQLQREAPLPVPRALTLAKHILRGLAAAHREGIVHRDLKPENIFITTDEAGDPVAKILDFGVSRVTDPEQDSDITRTGMVVGTPRYMAPEQFRSSRVDARADIYAASGVLFRALTGEFPYAGRRYDELLLEMHRSAATPVRSLRPELPESLAYVVDRGLARDPDGRWSEASDMLRAVERCARGETVPINETPTEDRQALRFGLAPTLLDDSDDVAVEPSRPSVSEQNRSDPANLEPKGRTPAPSPPLHRSVDDPSTLGPAAVDSAATRLSPASGSSTTPMTVEQLVERAAPRSPSWTLLTVLVLGA